MEAKEWFITGYDIANIKVELNKISDSEEKVSFLLRAKIEQKHTYSGRNVIARESVVELNALIEFWKYEAARSGKVREIKRLNRLNLTPNKKEKLHSKIVEEVNAFIEAGKGSQEQAFKKLSKNSKKLFGYELTHKQIQGRFARNKNKPF
ncbi:hypothetical protein C0389_00310 [bacterium]|nr:hypothetical protein [bacterium]